MGETLGNPRDAKGERTLEGFKAHMQTEVYRKGMAALTQLAQQKGTKLALTCAEAKDQDCHRSFILNDLKGFPEQSP